ncbi:hypothetical protein LZ554_008926 [Drepanopeziza brunnea f. sp. 'monogermtubi']|nr:hypothetical protein LZ554_008926 [Drepanopeziza brunnea f. sp. 'monogermtubi']
MQFNLLPTVLLLATAILSVNTSPLPAQSPSSIAERASTLSVPTSEIFEPRTFTGVRGSGGLRGSSGNRLNQGKWNGKEWTGEKWMKKAQEKAKMEAKMEQERAKMEAKMKSDGSKSSSTSLLSDSVSFCRFFGIGCN